MTIYVYVGKGAGVPGLPHQISDREAERTGVGELLKAAIENGSYEVVQVEKKSTVEIIKGVKSARSVNNG